MTLNEVHNYLNSYARREQRRLREKATFDYQLANLIGISVSRLFSANNKMPEIYEVYPEIFDIQEIENKRQEMRTKQSVDRLMDFVQAYNQQKEVKQ